MLKHQRLHDKNRILDKTSTPNKVFQNQRKTLFFLMIFKMTIMISFSFYGPRCTNLKFEFGYKCKRCHECRINIRSKSYVKCEKILLNVERYYKCDVVGPSMGVAMCHKKSKKKRAYMS